MKMRLKLPFFEQVTDFDCGPAALRMVLAYFGRRVPVQKLTRQMRTNRKVGTTRRNMARVARLYGLRVEAHSGATLDEARRAVKRRQPSIVEYILPKFEGAHYAVVAGFDGGVILLHDPTHGANYRMPCREFVRRWYGRHKRTHVRWLMTLTR